MVRWVTNKGRQWKRQADVWIKGKTAKQKNEVKGTFITPRQMLPRPVFAACQMSSFSYQTQKTPATNGSLWDVMWHVTRATPAGQPQVFLTSLLELQSTSKKKKKVLDSFKTIKLGVCVPNAKERAECYWCHSVTHCCIRCQSLKATNGQNYNRMNLSNTAEQFRFVQTWLLVAPSWY